VRRRIVNDLADFTNAQVFNVSFEKLRANHSSRLTIGGGQRVGLGINQEFVDQGASFVVKGRWQK
jgi:hypothetical protein